MTRLWHSRSGFRRSMQVSRTELFIFVEGRSDRYFYDRIADAVCQSSGKRYEVYTAEECTQGQRGTEALLSFFDYLKQRGSLIDKFMDKLQSLFSFWIKMLTISLELSAAQNTLSIQKPTN